MILNPQTEVIHAHCERVLIVRFALCTIQEYRLFTNLC